MKTFALTFVLILLMCFLVACAGPDDTVSITASENEHASTSENASAPRESAEEKPLNLSENKFILTLHESSADVKAIFEGKVEEFKLDGSDLDLLLFDLKEKYDLSLNYVREHIEINGKSYFDYTQFKEQESKEKEGAVKPIKIQVEIKTTAGKADAEVLFSSGNVDTFTLDTVDEDAINFDLADKYKIPLSDVKRLIKYYHPGEVKPDINALAEKVDQGVRAKIVEKDSGTLRSVGCDFFNHLLTFDLMISEGGNATLYGEGIGPYAGKRIIRFKLNSQPLEKLTCQGANAAALEFEPGVLYTCTQKEKGIYWTGEDDRYSDREDILAVKLVGAYDQINFKCE